MRTEFGEWPQQCVVEAEKGMGREWFRPNLIALRLDENNLAQQRIVEAETKRPACED
jgi:hypothetical protein